MDSTLVMLIEILVPLVHIAGAAVAVHAIMTVRTSQGAIAWALFLVMFPYLGLPLYGVFGRNKFVGYVKARRIGNLEINHVAEKALDLLKPYRLHLADDILNRYHIMERLVRLPCTIGNDAQLLVDGQAAFDAIFAAIKMAEKYILLQFFIVHDDKLGRELKARLLRKARQGVRIYFIYDQIGCKGLPGSYIEELQAGGVRMTGFFTASRVSRFQINFRNHRKITITDGRVGFIGGLNVGDEYMGRSRQFGPWRDTHLKVEGPAVQCIQMSFLEDWYGSTKEVPELEWAPAPAPGASRKTLVLPTGPADDFETCNLLFLLAIQAARHRLWITSPYFVPDQSIVDALQIAALRGVDVRIMLPEKPDHILVYLSSYSYYDEMEIAGVKLYRYQPGFMHQKVLLIDDTAAAVGTANLDNRSFRLNFELNVLLLDEAFAKNVEVMLKKDFDQCKRVTFADYESRRFLFKMAVNVSRLLAPIQ
ncbi:MAG: cardiolipin synthase [bacterium]